MKVKLTILALCISAVASAQFPNITGYTKISSRYNWLAGTFDQFTLPGRGDSDTTFRTGQWRASGAVIVDTVNHVVYFRSGGAWRAVASSGGQFGVSDTAVTTYRSLRIGSTAKINGEANSLIMRNRSGDSSLYNVSGAATVNDPYSPPMMIINKMLRESWNDTLSLQYGGALAITQRMSYDSTSTRFAAGARDIYTPVQGVYARGQVYPPRDSTYWIAGRDGQNGAVIQGDLDIGDTYGYNLHLRGQATDYPVSVFRSNVDLHREFAALRRKRMTGNITGYVSGWKSHQSTISSGTTETGNRWGQVSDFTSFGSLYPTIGSGATKSKILAVSRVDTATGFISRPKYLSTNEVRTGVGFWQQGADDYNWFQGKTAMGNITMPTYDNPQTATLNVGDVFKVHSDYTESNGSHVMYSDPAQLYGEFRSSIFGYLRDTANWALGSVLVNDINNREASIKVGENIPYATYAETGAGLNFYIRTGTHRTTWWRNGNVSIGAAANTYRLTHRLAVAGRGIFTDTLTATTMGTSDSSNRVATTAWVKRQGYGSGGGSTPTYEQVLTAGNSLSATAGIDYNTNEFVHSDIGNYIIENAGARKRININLSESRLASYSTDRFFRATDDSLFLGGVNFSADTTSHKPVWRNPVTGNLVYGYHATGSGGSGWALTGNAATAGASAGSWLGTNNNVSLRIRTNDVERTVIDSLGRFNHYGTSNHGIRLKQGAQASATAGTFFNGLTLENSSSTAAYSWAYAGGGLLALNYFNGTSTYTNLAYFTSAGKLGLNNTSPTAYLHLPAGSTAASSAPLKFTSASLQSTAEAGAVEFLTDKWYATITTGAARKEITLNDAALTSGTVPVATTNGRLTDGLIISAGTYTPTASAASGITVGTIEPFTWSRTGSTVSVAGYVSTSGVTPGTPCTFEITLPVASNLTTEYELTGNVSSIVPGSDGWLKGSAANNTAVVQWVGGATAGSQGFRVMFQYQVL